MQTVHMGAESTNVTGVLTKASNTESRTPREGTDAEGEEGHRATVTELGSAAERGGRHRQTRGTRMMARPGTFLDGCPVILALPIPEFCTCVLQNLGTMSVCNVKLPDAWYLASTSLLKSDTLST